MKATINLNGKVIEKQGNQFYFIAEIGTNYVEIAEAENRSHLQAAEMMIKQAALAGADAVKFQIYSPEDLASEKDAPAQFEYFKKHSLLTYASYDQLISYCKELKVEFMATLFTEEAIEYFGPKLNIFKVASPDITNRMMLLKIKRFGKPILISTAGCTLQEISKTLEWLGDHPVALLHCTGVYPTAEKDVNFGMIRNMNEYYPNLVIGYSDHINQDTFINSPLYAYLVGANIIEKHFTLNRFLAGNDHWHSLTPSTLRANINLLKEAGRLMGSYHKAPIPEEESLRNFGRRSLAASENINAGDTITHMKLKSIRPAIGIPPYEIGSIIGKKANKNIDENEIISYNMLEN